MGTPGNAYLAVLGHDGLFGLNILAPFRFLHKEPCAVAFRCWIQGEAFDGLSDAVNRPLFAFTMLGNAIVNRRDVTSGRAFESNATFHDVFATKIRAPLEHEKGCTECYPPENRQGSDSRG